MLDRDSLCKIVHRIVFVLTVITMLFIAIIEPTKEVMICDSYYHCQAESVYLWSIPIHKKFNVSKNSKMIPMVYYDWNIMYGIANSGYSGYKGYINVIDKNNKIIKPFRYYIIRSSTKNDTRKILKQNIAKFNYYLENPNIGFKAESATYALMILGAWLIAATVFTLFISLFKRFFK